VGQTVTGNSDDFSSGEITMASIPKMAIKRRATPMVTYFERVRRSYFGLILTTPVSELVALTKFSFPLLRTGV